MNYQGTVQKITKVGKTQKGTDFFDISVQLDGGAIIHYICFDKVEKLAEGARITYTVKPSARAGGNDVIKIESVEAPSTQPQKESGQAAIPPLEEKKVVSEGQFHKPAGVSGGKSNRPFACAYAKDVIIKMIEARMVNKRGEITDEFNYFFDLFMEKMGE